MHLAYVHAYVYMYVLSSLWFLSRETAAWFPPWAGIKQGVFYLIFSGRWVGWKTSINTTKGRWFAVVSFRGERLVIILWTTYVLRFFLFMIGWFDMNEGRTERKTFRARIFYYLSFVTTLFFFFSFVKNDCYGCAICFIFFSAHELLQR